MIFPKDEGVGKFDSGKSPTLGNVFFELLGQENTKNDHFSLTQQRFSFPHDWD